MEIHTANFGQLEVNPDDIISFPQGIPAFEHLQRYVLIHHEENSPFHYLQPLDDGELTFVLAQPRVFFPDYQIKLAKNDLLEIELQAEQEAVVLVMVTIPLEPSLMTANLQAPIVINAVKKLAKQVILNHTNYTTRHLLFTSEEKQSASR